MAPCSAKRKTQTVDLGDEGLIPLEIRWQHDAESKHARVRADYEHAFGSYSGTLPGGIELREGHGVRERQDAVW